jgi:hypothetical protein
LQTDKRESAVRLGDDEPRVASFCPARGPAVALGCVAAIAVMFLCGERARGQEPAAMTPESIQAGEIAEAEACHSDPTLSSCPHGSAATSTRVVIDPCFLKQNALRPCTAQDAAPPRKVIGVDPNLVGTWLFQQGGGFWVLEIHRDGTYKFHSAAADGAPSHAGSFGAKGGQWSLTATSGYPGWVDGGKYTLDFPDTWVATGKLGKGAWHRQSPTVQSSPAAQASASRKR